MKKNNQYIFAVLLVILSFNLHAMSDPPIDVSSRESINANFTGPISMTEPKVDASRETVSIINHYRNPDFTKGDPNASWFGQLVNAALESVPALVYEVPSHVVSSLAVQVLSQLILSKINGDKTSEIAKLKNLELCKNHFNSKMVQLSVSAPEYAEYKKKVEQLIQKESELEEKIYKELNDELVGESIGSTYINFIGEILNIEAIKNNLNYIKNKFYPSAA